VHVTRDTAVEDQRRLEYGELQTMINEMFPDSKVQLIPVADKLIVRGQARDEQESVQIMQLVRRNASLGGGGGGFGGPTSAAQGDAAEPFPDGSTLPAATVISLLKVPGEKQVLLKVRIAELQRSALRALGTDFDLDVGDFFLQSVQAAGGNILATGTFDDDSFNLVLRALATNGTAKILAEPNVVTLSGKPASFVSGGEFAVPTVVGVGGAQAATTTFKSFGTQVQFLPTVLDKDRIRLQVTPTFSTLNPDNSVDGIFGLDTRTVSTTVDLREGQVLAIAGLLQEQQRGDLSRVPLVGDIPVVSTLFSDKSVSRDETELIVLVSPELVHPLDPERAPTLLPGMEVTEPDDYSFFVYGAIEGRPECHHRSTVWPLYRNRLCRCKQESCETYRASENYYVHGPHGFSE
jgi:pilus assembly protein CpaC